MVEAIPVLAVDRVTTTLDALPPVLDQIQVALLTERFGGSFSPPSDPAPHDKRPCGTNAAEAPYRFRGERSASGQRYERTSSAQGIGELGREPIPEVLHSRAP